MEKENEFKAEKNPLLPLSQVWILSTTLPALYTQPILHSKPTPNCFNTQNFLSKFVSFYLISYFFLEYLDKTFFGVNLVSGHILPSCAFLEIYFKYLISKVNNN